MSPPTSMYVSPQSEPNQGRIASRLIFVAAIGAALAWVVLWRSLPISLHSARTSAVEVTMTSSLSPAEAEKAWQVEEGRILRPNPRCRLEWSAAGSIQHLTIAGEFEGALPALVASWAHEELPDATVAESRPAGVVEPFFIVEIEAKEWTSTVLWADRGLKPMVLSLDGVRRIQLDPAPAAVLYLSLDPHTLAQAAIGIDTIRAALEQPDVDSGIGPFRIEGKTALLTPGDLAPLRQTPIRLPGDKTVPLSDLATFSLSTDTAEPGTVIDGRPYLVMKVCTAPGTNHRALFERIKAIAQVCATPHEIRFREGADPQRMLARLLLIAALTLGVGALVLTGSGVSAQAVMRGASVIVIVSLASPLVTLWSHTPWSLESISGWALGLVVCTAGIVSSLCSRTNLMGTVVPARLRQRIGVPTLVVLVAVACASWGLDIPEVGCWEGAASLALTAALAILLAPVVLASAAVRGSPISPKITRILVRVRHVFARRLLVSALLLAAYAICGFLFVFAHLRSHASLLPSNRREVFVTFATPVIPFDEITRRLSSVPIARNWRADRSDSGVVLRCAVMAEDLGLAEGQIRKALSLVPGLGELQFLAEEPPNADEFLLRGEPLRYLDTPAGGMLWVDLLHGDRNLLPALSQPLARSLREMHGVSVDCAEDHTSTYWTVVPKESRASAENISRAIDTIAASQTRGIDVGRSRWEGGVYPTRLVMPAPQSADHVSAMAAVLRLPIAVSGSAAASEGRELTVGDVLKTTPVEHPSTITRKEGKPCVRLVVSCPSRLEGTVIDTVRGFSAMGLTRRLVRGDGFISRFQWLVLLLPCLFVLAFAAAESATGMELRTIAADSLGMALASLAGITLLAVVSETPLWNSQALVGLASSAALFAVGVIGRQVPGWRSGADIIFVVVVLPIAILSCGLPIEAPALLWIAAASLAAGKAWGFLVPVRSRAQGERAIGAEAAETRSDILEIRNITHLYPGTPPVRALDRASMRVPIGVFGLLGPNGAGKTTLMRILAGEIAPTRGDAVLDSISIIHNPRRGMIGFVPQSSGGYESLTVREYLDYAAHLCGGGDSVESAMEEVGVASHAEKAIRDLSGGYLKRLDIARALLARPSLLILDEPTSGLDPEVRAPLRQLIRDLGRSRTVIFATHLVEDVEATCTEIALINHGRVVMQSSLAACIEMFRGRVFSVAMDDHRQRLPGANGCRVVSQKKEGGRWLARFVTESTGVKVPGARPEEPRAEDAYVALIGEVQRERLKWRFDE